ncbi:hypothetical protein [Bradyrhizobium japonicum]|uniref:hypothetical protein n=1 Tax=Bradyrhizobium japonicum TaxID=375 RepID=UPI00126A17AA|nr:hypothetical protein [Bradyrhizobium japonicum]
MLLLATDWFLPAPPPSRVTDSHSALPPIRIRSQLKGPEAVVIDTRGPGLRPRLAEQDIAEAPSQPPETEVADAKVRSPAPPADLRLRESRAQLQFADQAGEAGRHMSSLHGRTGRLERGPESAGALLNIPASRPASVNAFR